MKTKTLLSSLALASLAIAQPVSAATRSADSLPQGRIGAAMTADRAGSLDGEAEELAGLSPLLMLVLLLGVVAVVVVATDGNQSPG